jgi:hypothetical protein
MCFDFVLRFCKFLHETHKLHSPYMPDKRGVYCIQGEVSKFTGHTYLYKTNIKGYMLKQCKTAIYKAYSKMILTYNARTWTLTKGSKSKIQEMNMEF